MRMVLPRISALDLNLVPQRWPSFMPRSEMMKAVMPMSGAARRRLTCRKAKETPTARVSMLVAMARRKRFLGWNDISMGQEFCSFFSAGISVLMPRKVSRAKAIHGLKAAMTWTNRMARR